MKNMATGSCMVAGICVLKLQVLTPCAAPASTTEFRQPLGYPAAGVPSAVR